MGSTHLGIPSNLRQACTREDHSSGVRFRKRALYWYRKAYPPKQGCSPVLNSPTVYKRARVVIPTSSKQTWFFVSKLPHPCLCLQDICSRDISKTSPPVSGFSDVLVACSYLTRHNARSIAATTLHHVAAFVHRPLISANIN